jgi:glycosyltransferase involved in cell wall biosynthesis
VSGTLRILRDGPERASPAGPGAVPWDEAARRARTGRLWRAAEAELHTHDAGVLRRPLLSALLVRLLGRRAWIVDGAGERRPVGAPLLAAWGARFARDLARRGALLRGVERDLDRLERALAARPPGRRVPGPGAPVYLRTDLWFGVAAGGSVAHVAGVANGLDAWGEPPAVLTTDPLPLVRPELEQHVVRPGAEFWDFPELPDLAFNRVFEERAAALLRGRRVAFLYQRCGTHGYAGASLALARGVPLVVEFNGSAAWMGRHWGRPLRYEALAGRIERAVLAAAELVVVVSEPLRDGLEAAGIPRERILVNPNGVDPDRYSPDVDGSRVRARYGLGGAPVVGFIGTFGPWHGAEVLADAWGRMLARRSDLRGARLLMIGSGARLEAARAALERGGAAESAAWTGLVPQEAGAEHLAACDVLVSPHVPNPDGSEFFGSPTKLFEYLAMGRAVVASGLGQIGEVVRHGENGWLVPPGDADALADAVARLLDDPELRARLGAAARGDATERWSWRAHVGRTLAALRGEG